MLSHLGLQNLVQNRLQENGHSSVALEQLLDLLVVDRNLNSSHRGSALVVGLTRLQPGRTRWLCLSSRVSYTIIGTQPAGKTALKLALRDGEKTVANTTVSNDPDGHEQLLRWLQEQGAGSEKTDVCMEASGDSEKAIARRLYEEDYRAGARVQGESRSTRQAN
jgi:hypothetical protein